MRARLGFSTMLVFLAVSGAAVAEARPLEVLPGRFAIAATAHGGAPNATLEAAAPGLVRSAAPWTAPLALQGTRTVRLVNGERIVRLAQTHAGLPVAYRGAAVTFGADDAARLVTLHLEDDLPSDVTPAVDARTAASIAQRFGGVPVDPSRARLAIWPSPGSARLAWVVYARLDGLPTAPVVVVDAKTGRVIVRFDAARRLDQANVYPTNPVKSPTLMPVTLPVTAGSMTLDNTDVQSLNCIDNHSLKDLMGMPIHVCDLLQTAIADVNGDFLMPPAADTDPEDAFAEVSLFYHTNRVYSFFRGFEPTLQINGGVLPTISNLRFPQGLGSDPVLFGDPDLPLEPFENAFFSPADPIFTSLFDVDVGALWFGQGSLIDFAYDGDVVYHEFTHSVVDVTLKLISTPHFDEYGVSMSPGAMNEGLADFFSSALAGDPDVGEYAGAGFGTPGAIRTIDNHDACPTSIGGEVHQDSTLFSGALWQVRSSLPDAQRPDYDLAIYTAMNSSPSGDLAYEDFAKIIDATLEAAPTLGASVAGTQKQAFTDHGIFPRCTRLLEYLGAPMSGPAAQMGYWYAPGILATGAYTQDGWTPGAVQFHAKVTADAATVYISSDGFDAGTSSTFGEMGSRFAPSALVAFDHPIAFKIKPLEAKGARLAKRQEVGPLLSASIEVPAGAKDVYVMVVNSGEDDGVYTQFSIDFQPPVPPLTTSSSSSATTGAGGGGGSSEVIVAEGNGCGCAAVGRDVPGPGGAAALTVVLAALRRRRRRHG